MAFRRGVKPETVEFGHRLFALGLGTLAITLTGAVLLVLDVAVGRGFAVPAAVAVGAALIGLWFLLPLPLLRSGEPVDPDEPPPGEQLAGDRPVARQR